MIDRIKVRLHEPLIDPNNKLQITPMGLIGGMPAGPYIDLDYMKIGKKQVSRVDFNLDGLCTISSYRGYLYAEFNFPKLKSGGKHNIWPVTVDEACKYVDWLTWQLCEVGLITDLCKSVVVNMELFSDAATKYSFSEFMPLLNLLDISRKSRAVCDNSFTFFNSQRTDIIYDKKAQVSLRVADELPENYIRYEYRFNSDDAVKVVLGTNILEEVLGIWELLREKYIGRIRDVLLDDKLSFDQPLQENLGLILGLKKRQEVLPVIGAISLIKQFGSISTIRTELRRLGYKPYEVRYFLRKLQKYAAQNTHTEIRLDDLRTELFNKLVQGLNINH